MLKLSNRTIRDIKRYFILNSFHFIYFVKFWYGLTMRLTKIDTNRVSNFQTLDEIPSSYGWGTRYKSDPLNGMLDYLTHPSRLARNAELGDPFGDCDDHAIYWCVALLKAGHARRTWFCIYQMEKQDGSFSGHAICVYESVTDGMYYWTDYPLPRCLDEYRDKWIYTSAETYDETPLAGAMIEVEAVKEDDTPVFGKITVLKL